MRPNWRQLFCVLALWGFSGQIRVAAQDSTAALPGKEPLRIFITASHKNGSPATLVSSDVVGSVDKKPAEITNLHVAKDEPLLFAVLVDVSKSDAQNSAAIKNAALQLFQGLSVGRNRGYLVLFNEFVRISNTPVSLDQVKLNLDAVKFGGGTAIYDAIELTCLRKFGALENVNTPRRAIILISDGEDNSSHVPHTKAEETAEKEGVAVFSLVTHSDLAGPRGRQFLRETSRNTGGWMIDNKDLVDGIAPLLAAVDEQWALSLTPAQSPDQKMHSLEVKSTANNVEISAPSKILLR